MTIETKTQNVTTLDIDSVREILSKANKVECDDDLDGIASGAMLYKYFKNEGKDLRVELQVPGKMIEQPKPNEVLFIISDEKVVPSDKNTIVLDKTTEGDGWVIDHHKSKVVAKNFMAFCEDGSVPTSRLTYLILPKKNDDDLFLSTLGTIMDGLAEFGEKDGSIKEFIEKYPGFRSKSKYANQFLRDEELYTIGDMVALLPTKDALKSFNIAVGIEVAKINSINEVMSLLDKEMRQFAENYLNVISNPPRDKFITYRIAGHEVKAAKNSELQPYPMPILAQQLREDPGNKVLVKDSGLSVRTSDPAVFEAIADIYRKVGIFKSGGGRQGWYGVQFTQDIGEKKALELLRADTNI